MATYIDAIEGKHTDGSEQEVLQESERVLTDKEYIDNIGSECIYCKSDQIVGGDTDFDDVNAYRLVRCESCHMEWEEIFTMVGTQPRGGL